MILSLIDFFDSIITLLFKDKNIKQLRNYEAPYTVTGYTINLVAQVMLHIGRLEGLSLNSKPSPELRRQNRIKTIYSTLAIEGNTLSLEQVSAVMSLFSEN